MQRAVRAHHVTQGIYGMVPHTTVWWHCIMKPRSSRHCCRRSFWNMLETVLVAIAIHSYRRATGDVVVVAVFVHVASIPETKLLH